MVIPILIQYTMTYDVKPQTSCELIASLVPRTTWMTLDPRVDSRP